MLKLNDLLETLTLNADTCLVFIFMEHFNIMGNILIGFFAESYMLLLLLLTHTALHRCLSSSPKSKQCVSFRRRLFQLPGSHRGPGSC